MAAKWKAQQRKQRWEHSAVLLPQFLISAVEEDPSLTAFSTVLGEWSRLGNTYNQVSGAKRLVGALESVAVQRAAGFSLAVSIFIEILFLEGSRPVHRTMLSSLAQLQTFQVLVENSFEVCCRKYGQGGGEERRFALVGVGLSLASMPKPGILSKVVERCSEIIALSACADVRNALERAQSGENLTPALMENCQDAMSTIYYMLQHISTEQASVLYEDVLFISVDVLQTSLMSRDCVVAAGVCLCAVAQMTSNSRCSLALFFANALFPHGAGYQTLEDAEECEVEAVLRTIRSSSLAAEAEKFTEFGRLCVLRGLLTAAPRELLNFCLLEGTAGKEGRLEIWTLLHDGILPALCDATEKSFDSHFKFHGMTALQICLQQIKASITGSVMSAALKEIQERIAARNGLSCAPFTPFPSAMTSRIMQIIWNNWEDPLNQTVRQVQMVFDLLADLQSFSCIQGVSTTQDGTISFLHQIARDLLTVGGHRKGRYVPLATLAVRIGAQTLLDMSPDLLFQTVYAMSDDGVCCAASTFLKIFLERLRDEWWSRKGVGEGSLEFRRLWIPPLLAGLVAGNPKLRINLHTYALPIGFEIDSDSLLHMLGYVLSGSTSRDLPAWEELQDAAGMPEALTQHQRVGCFVSLIKVARTLALMENEIRTSDDTGEIAVLVKGTMIYAPVSLLELALTHLEEGLRVDAAELICLNPKTAVMPSPLELHLLKLAMPLNMRCSSTAFRMKWTSLLKKFFNRVRIATDRQLKFELSKSSYQNGFVACETVEDLVSSVVSLSEMQAFMQWLTRLLVSSLYPSAPYERKYMAMEILNILLDVWLPTKDQGSTSSGVFTPYGKELFSADYTMILLGAVVDSWDRLRENAYRILLRYPTPLPGLDKQGTVAQVLNWGKALANSPRVRESDAGALVLRLLFRKYVCELRWRISLHPTPEVLQASQSGDEIVHYIESLNDWLEAGVLEGERNLLKACKQSLVHGVLLTFRYTVSEVDWISDAVRANVTGLRRAFGRLFRLILKVTSLALWVVSVDALNLQDKGYESQEDADVLTYDEEPDDEKTLDEDYSDEADDATLLAPKEQMVMVGCWLSMKEVSLLLGTIARSAPLPGCSYNSKTVGEGREESFVMLESGQLEKIGQHFLQVLLAMKHNGAIDKTRVGFVALCNRLLLSSETRLSKMPKVWMQQLMGRTIAKGQSLDDLLRRSAGIPAAFLALFLSEPDGAPKKLLPMALTWFIDYIKRFTSGLEVPISDVENDSKDNVVPVVHAFNTLRVTFNDTYLSTDTSGFCAEAMIVAIQAFASPYWQVRNSATLAFTALLHRTVGFMNVHKNATARRAITGFEFFNRYPALHPFLLKELQLATMLLETGCEHNVTESRVHPSLAPVLIVLSRLRPSILNTRVDDWLSPSAFMPSVMKCATLSHFKVRLLASRALAPLVTSDNLLNVLLELVHQLLVGKARFNTVHGVLLQISSLLKSNCKELPNQEQQAQIAVELFKNVKSCDFPRLTLCPIAAAAFLTVVKDLLELAYQCKEEPSVSDTIQKLQCLTSRRCRETIDIEPTWDSTRVELRAVAAKIYFTVILREWSSLNNEEAASQYITMDQTRRRVEDMQEDPDFYKTLGGALADCMYEVRLSTLKVLTTFSGSRILRSPKFLQDGRTLHGLLADRLYTERHPRCVKRLLQAFLSWELLTIGDVQQDARRIWQTILGIYNDSKVSKTREYAVRCLGSCFQHLTAVMKKEVISSENESEVYREVLDTWDQLIQKHRAASEPVNMRRAVASAIISSKCLEDVRWLKEVGGQLKLDWYRKTVLKVWSVSINLMEDEDITLRQQLALAVQHVMSGHNEAAVAAQVEKVLENGLAFLTSQFEDWNPYFDFVAGLVLGEERFEVGDVQNADLVRKLFDKELDNHHEEPLLVVQLCCSHIRAYVGCQQSEATNEFINIWRNRFLRQTVACARWCMELQKNSHWVGGITNHQDVFKYLYRTLLGLLALATPQHTQNSREELRFGLLELTALKNAPLSPMVSNLLLTVLQEYEQQLGLSLDSETFRAAMGDSFCSEFEPFFLLR